MNIRIVKRDEMSVTQLSNIVDVEIVVSPWGKVQLEGVKVCECCGQSISDIIYEVSDGERLMIF